MRSARENLSADEETLRWAALQKLPTYDRLRKTVLKSFSDDDDVIRVVDVRKLGTTRRREFIDRFFKVADEDNDKFLSKLKNRIDRVGINLPQVEVRFEHLNAEADSFVDKGRAIPTLPNAVFDLAEKLLSCLGLKGVARKTRVTILKDVSGIVKPSRMTLLLGPPSSGKTTLMLALSGRLDNTLKRMGEITYNGYMLDEFVPQRTSAYVSQNDVHVGEMTVQETLDFSARCQGVGWRYDLLTELARREREADILPEAEVDLFMKATSVEGQKTSLITDYTLKILGLDRCRDTVVGDEMSRGISGGEKKRVTTGEMMVGPKTTLFMDEISTGLDSSTTFQIVKCLQQIAHLTEATIFMSLLQPSPETFNLFDDIFLLSEGQIVYQGPKEHVVEFFDSCGFKCPERKGIADFLQEVTSRKDQEQYWADKSKPYDYISVAEFANRFKIFHVGQSLKNELSIPYDKSASHLAALVFEKNSVPKWDLFKANLDKEWLLIRRNSFVYIFKSVQIFVVALVAATLFLRTRMQTRNEQDSALYVGALLFSMTCNTFNGILELSLTMKRLPVFYKHRDLLFHSAWAFTLPSFLLRVPISVIEATVWTVTTYYTIGFAPEPNQIPDWLGWSYWVFPLSYAYNALVVNEMFAPRWMNKLASDNTTRLGTATLNHFNIPPDENWYWIGLIALIGFTILFNVLFTISLMYLNPLVSKHATIISKEVKGADLDGATNDAQSSTKSKKGMVLPFTPLVMSFDSVNYFVDMPSEMKEHEVKEDKLQLLIEVTGAFRPGVLTALMGVSGAGKTTLMDVLAGRKTGGYVQGDIRISGFPKNQETFARISGYCEQTDIHSPQVTVHESLIFSAFLRLPKEVTREQKMAFVDEVMDLVELDDLKDAIVGIPGESGLSTEQRKRLTIAVELVANPSIIFMDEPTSGLDARAAAIVMRTVRNTVDTGRTVVCTIHQPSIDIFEAFDELLLMKRGGQVIYAGPLGQESKKVIEYFEAIPGVPRIKDKCNPATWMLEVSSVATEARLGIDFAEHYKSSDIYQQNKALVKEMSNTPTPDSKDLSFDTQYSQSMWGQFKSCLWKQWWTYWRSPDYNLVRYIFTLASALLLGTIFWKVGKNRNTDTDLLTIIGAMYATILLLGITNGSTVQQVVLVERTVFYREKAAGMYSALPYAMAHVVLEIPYVLFQTTYYTLIVYAMLGFEWTAAKYLWFFAVNFVTFLYFTYYGMMAVSLTPNQQLAAVFAGAFYALFNLFSGFFVPRPSIPTWWRWYSWISPTAWTIYGLIIGQYGDVEDTISVAGESTRPMIKTYIQEHFGYDPEFEGPLIAILICFALCFAFTYAYCIKTLNFQKRNVGSLAYPTGNLMSLNQHRLYSEMFWWRLVAS
ncbi:ABC transporter family pleiotropic drugresistance protein [Striga asiatica]|uniref:ABC transporter family pleiotropic drugresistance protein n=1 Tax=Striga asiatica TaxID=4170 RepID=A0A5A7PU20_STRAF|nr:ABC transporter family pleiotropic drugresistance protein [Striga asiatica]